MATQKKVQFILDVDKKPVDVAIDSTLNLKQAFRELTKELNRTKEGTKEFELLSSKLGEVKDQIDKTNVKSRDFFSSLSMLPGPVGAFAGSVDTAISSLKLFTSFSFKDLKFQLKETADDIKDVVKNIFGLTVAQEANTVAQTTNAASSEAAAAANVAQTAAVTAEATATKGATVATISFSQALKAIGIGFILAGLAALVAYWDKIVDAVTGATDVTKAYDEAQAEVTKQVGDFQKKLFEVQGALKAAKAGTMDKKEALKQYNDKLGDSVGYAKSLTEAEDLIAKNTKTVIEGIRLRAQAQVFYSKSAEAAAKAVSGEGVEPDFWDKTLNVIKAFGNPLGAVQYDIQTIAENYGELNSQAKTFATEGDKLIQQAIELDKTINKPGKPEEKKTETKEDPRIQATKDLYKKLGELQDENTVLAVQKEREKQDKELQVTRDREIKEVNALKLKDTIIDGQMVKAEDLRAKILEQIKTKYKLKADELQTKRDEEDKKKKEEALDKLAEIAIAAEKDETERAIKERERRYTKEKEALDKALKDQLISLKEYNKAAIELEKTKESDKAKIRNEANLKEKAIAKGDRDAQFVRLMAAAQFDLDYQRQLLDEKKKKDDEYYKEQLAREGLTTDQIREINEKKLADQITYTQQSNQLERDRVAVRQKVLDDIISIVGAESAVGRAALIAKQILMAKEMIMEIRRTITFSKLGLARSKAAVAEGTAQTAKVGFPQNIPLLIGYAAQAAAIISAVISATKSAESAGGGGGEGGGTMPTGENLGRNYESGGIINGPRHAQGGVLINAEGGEAVMTRGAVTMFAPLLSAMNQMGGGTSFNSAVGQALPDAPAVTNPALNQQPMIMKTYVVSNELTTEAERQSRLKDLSTL